MRPRINPGQAALLRAIRLWLEGESADGDRPVLIVEAMDSEAWASATFMGERHRLEIRIEGHDAATVAARIAAGLAEAELPLPGRIVADVALVRQHRAGDGSRVELTFEILTVAD